MENKKLLEKKEALKELKEIIKKGVKKDGRKNVMLTYTIERVAASGMSRCLKVYCETKEGVKNITYLVAKINDDTFTKDGCVRVQGCGMDMLFNTSYTLNQEAKFLDKYKGTKKDCYNYIVSTYYNMF